MTRIIDEKPSAQLNGRRDAGPGAMPRLGFVGTGWIGRHRMRALIEAEAAEVVAIADPSKEALGAAGKLAPSALKTGEFDELLARAEGELDGIVIATPSALHAQQAVAALERGLAVFCQKPLARTAAEARAIVEAARAADRLLGLDLSYRYTAAYRAVSELIRNGELGDLYALDLTFHNAYGPDKAWCRDPALCGGGCMMDLGVHLIDLALLSLGWPDVDVVACDLFVGGRPTPLLGGGASSGPAALIRGGPGERPIEDHAIATLRTPQGQSIRIACSWNMHAGQDAAIEMAFHGADAGAAIRNCNGSFYDFTAELLRGTARTLLVEPPDAWGGRAAVAWARRLALMGTFDPEAERFVQVSHVLDRMYQQ